MALREEFETTGRWLFRWRSYLPLLLAGIILAGLVEFEYPGHDHALDLAWEMLCLALALLGLGLRAYTTGHTLKGTSGRNTKTQRALALNTTGAYSLLRHPLYLANYFCWLGIALFPRVWWVAVMVTLVFWLYYERIMFAEEEFLRRTFGPPYEAWAGATPAFVPRLSLWRPPESPFSMKTVLRREPSSWLAVVSCFCVQEIAGDLLVEGTFEIDPFWLVLFSATLAAYAILKIMKNKKMLHVTGR